MPRRAIRCGGNPVMSSPSENTWPEVGANAPVMMLNKVVLPQPLGPIRHNASPESIARLIPLRTRTPPNVLVTSRISSRGGMAIQLLDFECEWDAIPFAHTLHWLGA